MGEQVLPFLVFSPLCASFVVSAGFGARGEEEGPHAVP